jgi:hypothetical protein
MFLIMKKFEECEDSFDDLGKIAFQNCKNTCHAPFFSSKKKGGIALGVQFK